MSQDPKMTIEEAMARLWPHRFQKERREALDKLLGLVECKRDIIAGGEPTKACSCDLDGGR